MREKLAGYSLLSFLSFCIFITVFSTVASAQDGVVPVPSDQPTMEITPPPTPAVLAEQVAMPTPTSTPTDSPTPTPDQSQPTDAPTPTDSPTPTPTTDPTTTPTATPTPTSTPTPTQPPPTPTPTTAPATQPSGSDLDAWFTKYADQYHIDRELLRRIAQCESGFNTNSNNNNLYLGMYQFSENTWVSTRSSMGLDTNPALRTNAEEAIKTAAYKISQGGAGAWPNCN